VEEYHAAEIDWSHERAEVICELVKWDRCEIFGDFDHKRVQSL
jgi:hypothetical protein